MGMMEPLAAKIAGPDVVCWRWSSLVLSEGVTNEPDVPELRIAKELVDCLGGTTADGEAM